MAAVFALSKMSALWYAKHSALRGRNRLHVWKSADDEDAVQNRQHYLSPFLPFSLIFILFAPLPLPPLSTPPPVSSPLWVSGYFPISTRLPGPILGSRETNGTSGYFWLWKMVVTNWFDIWWNVCNVSLFLFFFSPSTTTTATLLQPLATRSDEQELLLCCSCIYVLYGYVWYEECVCASAVCVPSVNPYVVSSPVI